MGNKAFLNASFGTASFPNEALGQSCLWAQCSGVCNFVINEFNPTFEVQNMGNEAFQNASFGNASFPNEALSYSCLWT